MKPKGGSAMTMQSVMFYFQQFCLFGSSFFSFLCQIISGRGQGFHFFEKKYRHFVSNRREFDSLRFYYV